MTSVPTVCIVHPTDPADHVVINAADFNPALHRLVGAPEPDEVQPPAPVTETSGETPWIDVPTTDTAEQADVYYGYVGTFVSTVLAHKADDAKPAIAVVIDPVLLDALKASELAGKKRVSVLAAIDAQMATLPKD